jgi:hypothetical protein
MNRDLALRQRDPSTQENKNEKKSQHDQPRLIVISSR